MESRPLLAPLTLLRRAPGFRLLFFATFGSSLGSLLAVIALAIDVKDRTDSGNWLAALLLANLLPGIALGLTLGPLLDRLSRKRLMIGADLVRLAAFCALPFAGSALAIVLLALVAGVALSFFRPAAYAGLRTVIVVWSVAMIGKAMYDVAEVFLAKNTFSAHDFGDGLLFGAGGT